MTDQQLCPDCGAVLTAAMRDELFGGYLCSYCGETIPGAGGGMMAEALRRTLVGPPFAPYDAYEISKVVERDDGDGPYCERTDHEHERGEDGNVIRAMWSVYGHIPDAGAECLTDFATREEAVLTVSRILGRQVVLPGDWTHQIVKVKP